MRSHSIRRFFRAIGAEQFMDQFSSDRRHMRRPDGTWIKPPPPYSPIQNGAPPSLPLEPRINFRFAGSNNHNLDEFICMEEGKGPGNVYSLSEFVYKFYKLPLAQNGP